MSDSRLLTSLEHNCGKLIMDAVRDPDVLEIMLNPDGKVWTEKYGEDQKCIGELPIAQSKLILSLVASALDLTVDSSRPVVEGSFPLDGSRFEGVFPPIVGPGASFSMRKKASRIITMEEYLASGVITPEVLPIIDDAIADRIAAVRSLDILSYEEKEAKSAPPAPFTTSTLQQAASNALKFKPKKTMDLAQKLYEGGHIT